MTRSRFFQISLSLPLLIWGISLVAILHGEGAGVISQNILQGYRVFVPYIIFSAVLWKISSGQPYRTLILLAWIIPLLWGIFFSLFYVVTTLIVEHRIDRWYVPLIMAFWAVLVAYVVEIIPLTILTVFKNDFRPEANESGALPTHADPK